MEVLLNGLPYIQISLAIILMAAVLLQQRGAGLGGALGGGDEGTIHYERRGSERTLFRATMVVALLFVVASSAPLFIAKLPVVEAPTNDQSSRATENSPIVQMTTQEATTTVNPEDVIMETNTLPPAKIPLTPLGE